MPEQTEGGMRRTAPFVIWLVLLVGACSDEAPVATSTGWTGPVREATANAVDDGDEGSASTNEEGDAARAYVDIERASVDSPTQPQWRIRLAAAPPEASTLDPAHTVISYGLVFETTGDDAPDYIVGISNEGSDPGTYLVWVTDLATGETVEQDGPAYGYPVEFAHPDEGTGEITGAPEMIFTFLDARSRPPGVSARTRFYAWASVEEEGALVGWDYAPDAGWIGASAEAAATPQPEPAPVGAVSGEPVGFPECQAKTFAFVGEGTLRELGLDTATAVTPPDIDRPAKIWVTADLMPYDPGPEGGPVQGTRMLCFEFAGGSGGSGWPVDPAWQPPAAFASTPTDADAAGPAQPNLGVLLLVLVVVAGSALAFRRR